MSFPLFHLPNVALSEVFNATSPSDMFRMRLSLCSKKAQLIVKHTFIKWKQRRSLELILHGAEPSTVNYSYFPLLSIHDWPAIVNSTHIETVQIGVFTVPMDTSSKATYWVHKLEAIRSVLNYVMEIFNSEIQCFDIEDDVTSSELNWIFNWMTGRTTIFKAIYVNITQATTEDLNLFFQNVKVSDCLELRGSRNSDNCYPPYPFFQSVRHFINIINGFWLEKRHLDSLNCTVIYMSKTRFSSEDMNIYLKKWKEGQAFSRLKCSLIDITDANTEKLLEGMDVTEVQTVRKYKTLRETYIKLHGGFDITRHDGVVATVNIRRRRGANEFTWVVWPDLIHGESILDEQIDYL